MTNPNQTSTPPASTTLAEGLPTQPLIQLLIIACLLRLLLASVFPMTNDEAYYWDWGRVIHLSYLDHPPAVAWISWLTQILAPAWGHLPVRMLCPPLFAVASFFLIRASENLARLFQRTRFKRNRFQRNDLQHNRHDKADKANSIEQVGLYTLLFSQVLPAYSLLGHVLLPDTGLYVGISLGLYGLTQLLEKQLGPTDPNRPRATQPALAGHKSFWPHLTGLGFGLSIAAKYHALILVPALLTWFVAVSYAQSSDRQNDPSRTVSKGDLTQPRSADRPWLSVFLSLLIILGWMLVVSVPVWWWNIENGWASLRFQSDHGFAGLQWRAFLGMQALVGQWLFLTPWIWWLFYQTMFGTVRLSRLLSLNPRTLYACLVLIPLLGLFSAVSFFKQTLPHWYMPSFWLAIPVLSAALAHVKPSKLLRGHLIWATFCSWLLPWVLALPISQQALVGLFAGSPSPLTELTLWPELARKLEQEQLLEPLSATFQKDLPEHCPKQPTLASMRWFWAAQLAYHLKGRPRVLSLDPHHRSYYSFRDESYLQQLAGCPLLIVADPAHGRLEQLKDRLEIDSSDTLIIPKHEGQAAYIARAIVR